MEDVYKRQISLLFDFTGGRLSFLLAASGGVMISISLVELIPEAIEVGSKAMAAACLLYTSRCV